MSAGACAKKLLCDALALAALNAIKAEVKKPNPDMELATRKAEFVLEKSKEIYMGLPDIV